MALSSELISQLVKVTNDKTEVKQETTVYGVIKEHGGSLYVQIDGSDILTPIDNSTTVDVKDKERVTVLIKNHSAVVTGNISHPAARHQDIQDQTQAIEEFGTKISEFEIVIADKVSSEQLEAERARINAIQADNVRINEELEAQKADISELNVENATITEKLEADEAEIETLKTTKLDADIADAKYATIDDLEATDANIHNLEATYGQFASATATRFEAIEAEIDNLDVGDLDVSQLEAKFANIDFSNIGEAAIRQFFSESGLIEDVVVGEGTVTGKLVGVTISGDLIEGNTVVAEKLVIKGEDGLYYKLNTDGVTTASEQTDYNSLNGSVIKAKSITADKISVTDLVAFGATIGGFKITNNSLYSGTKSSIDNMTRGVYMDSTGQFSLGDTEHYLRYFKLADGNYKLEISAGSIYMLSKDDNLDTIITDMQNEIQDVANVEIGGRNLLINSANMTVERYGNTEAWYESGVQVPEWNATDAHRIYGWNNDNVIIGTLSAGVGIASTSQYYASSIYIKNNMPDDVIIVSANHLGIAYRVEIGPSEVKRVELVGPGNGWGYIQLNFKVPVEGDPFDFTYWHPKFENGNKVTDWTPAPEDLASADDLDVVSSKATTAESKADSATTLIQQLAESISMLVTDGNGVSLMKQTESGWTFSTSDIERIAGNTSELLAGLSNEVGDVSHAVDILKQTVGDLDAASEYVKIGRYGGAPCIELGAAEAELKLRIMPHEIIFTKGSEVLARLDTRSLHIKSAVIEDDLQQGGFVWKSRDNGNLGLVWKGRV